jgi:hypothetical protein
MTNNKKSLIVLVAALFLTVGSGSAFAAFQFDAGLTWPFFIGGVSADGDVEGFNMTDLNTGEESITLVFPDLQFHYYWQLGPVKLGPGIRMIPLFIINALYPVVSAEMDLLIFRFNFTFGGGLFAWFGITSGAQFVNLWFPELSVAIKAADWVNFGVSATGIVAPDLTTEGMGFAISAFVKFSFEMGK